MSFSFMSLFDGGPIIRLTPGERLFDFGEPVSHIVLVRDGRIDLTRPRDDGDPVVLHRAGPGEILAEHSAYAPRHSCGARAGVSSVLSLVPAAEFRERLAAIPMMAETWAAHLAQAAQAARLRAEIRGLRTVRERLDVWLAAGRSLPPRGEWQDIAAELGVTREAFYRELARRRPDLAAE